MKSQSSRHTITPGQSPALSLFHRRFASLTASFFLSLLAFTSLHADVLWVADFDEGLTPIDVAPTSLISDVATISHSFAAHSTAEPALGNTGYSLKVNFTNGTGSNLVITFGTNKDLTSYRALSFWVRGAAGGEKFQISLKRDTPPQEPNFDPLVSDFLPSGVTTSWQKVVIPLQALLADYVVNSSTALSDINGIVLTIGGATPTEVFYLDDLLFHTKAAPIWVDNFDDTNTVSSFGRDRSDVSSAGTKPASLSDTTQSSSPPGSLKIDWDFSGSPTFALTNLKLHPDDDTGNIGVDISGCNTLTFKTLAGTNGNGKAIRVGIKDETTERFHTSSVTISDTWSDQTFPLSSFTDLDKNKTDLVELWFAKDASPVINNPDAFTVFIDDVRFLDTMAPLAPSLLADDGTSVVNGHFFGLTNTITFAEGTSVADQDATLESVRFEHDGLSGGTAWYRVFLDTNTAAASHSFTWNTTSLQPGTTYQVRVVAMDIAGNQSILGPFTNIEISSRGKTTTIGKEGGSVSIEDSNPNDGETTISIPAGALDRDTSIALTLKSAADVPAGVGFSRTTPLAAIQIGPSGTIFRRPVSLTVLYLDTDSDGLVEDPDTGIETSIQEQTLKLFTHDGFEWKNLGGVVNASQNTVTASISHLSSFAIFPTASGTTSIKPKEKIITPSGSPGMNDTLNFGGNPTGAKIEIYDVSGRLVRRIENETSWNGRDGNGKIVESGIYIYRAEIDGEKVTGTITVAR